jgi:osmotically-inducible protein OsmY
VAFGGAMSKIYVVMGSTGEYSDRSEWPVVAFRDEEEARKRVENATRRAKELEATKPRDYRRITEHFKQNEFDPDMRNDYTGTAYYYMTVELL